MDKMIGYCGLDCTKCDAYLATIHNDDALRERTAKKWAELNNAPITADMINCMGCRMDGVKTPFCDFMCEIKQCAKKKEVETCRDCEKKNECKTLESITNYSQEAKDNILNTEEK